MKTQTKLAARGKWLGILVQAGFDPQILNGKHQACPMCGGKDRFRWTNYKDGGEYFCSGCGPGDGFNLIADRLGVDFKYAASEVDMLLGNKDIPEVFQPKIDVEKRRFNLNELWKCANNDNVMIDYLTGRGIEYQHMADLRGCHGMYNSDTGKRQPGMCALIRNHKGIPVSIHRTFFDPKAKKIMPPTEKIVGASVHLNWEGKGSRLVIGEGIETTLMGVAKYGGCGAAAISAHGMETIEIWTRFTNIIILADNDKSFTGQAAAFVLAKRLSLTRQVTVVMSTTSGQDFLDMETCSNKGMIRWHNES